MQVARGVGHGEQGLEIEVQGRVAERREIDEGRVSMGRLQSKREVHRDCGGSAAAFGVDHGKNLTAGTFFLNSALGRGQAYESLEKIGRGGGAFDKLARPT